MRPVDLISLAWANLRRNRMRTFLTLIGVTIGVAALYALLAYGSGVQQNMRNEFNGLEMYNTLRITSRPDPIAGFSDQFYRTQPKDTPEIPLTDALISEFANLDGVFSVYPEIAFPAVLRAPDSLELACVIEAVPMNFSELPAYHPVIGSFFDTPNENSIIISASMARRLGFENPETLVGERLMVSVPTLNWTRLQSQAEVFNLGNVNLPIEAVDTPITVVGILAEEGRTLSGTVRALLPLETAQQMRKVTFFSTIDLLMRRTSITGYSALRVQLSDSDALETVQAQIQDKGVFATSFRQQFSQIERLFRIMDLALAVIGFIALLVATIGIANTMTMSVMERYREIGVMKAIGGDEADLQRLFLAESGLIGLIGCGVGLVFGWGLTRLINVLANHYLSQFNLPYIELFFMPMGILLGIVGITLFISLAAGVLPARKAARITPMSALRYT